MPSKTVRAWRRANGKCEQCGRPHDDPAFYRCSSCREKNRKRYAKRQEDGCCPDCGQPSETTSRCPGCLQRGREKDARKRKKIRDEVFAAYGGYVCKCCGETTPEFLQLDHKNNDGGDHRREIGGSQQLGGLKILYWLKKNNFPPIMQVLCANCNFAKGHYGKCPHQT